MLDKHRAKNLIQTTIAVWEYAKNFLTPAERNKNAVFEHPTVATVAVFQAIWVAVVSLHQPPPPPGDKEEKIHTLFQSESGLHRPTAMKKGQVGMFIGYNFRVRCELIFAAIGQKKAENHS